MRDAHLLGLALLAAMVPACKKTDPDPLTSEPPSVVAPASTEPVATKQVAPAPDCANATLPGTSTSHTIRYADGTGETVHGMSADAWATASARLLTECKALGPEAKCDGGLIAPADLLCRSLAHTPGGNRCNATLVNQTIYSAEQEKGLVWELDCGWLSLQLDPRTAEVLSRSEIMEGRPLMGEHGAVLPEVCGTDDPVAQHWLSMAAAELASVHSFERHLSELRSLNAPQSILDAVESAARDEAQHAALCVELADEGSLGPMPATPAPRRGALEILRAVLVEACVNETVAALLVRRAAASCADGHRAAILHRIADDEQRHAALAWRTLAWGLQTYPELFAPLQTALRESITRVDVRSADVSGDGILDEAQTRRAVRDAIEHAVMPAWGACVSQASPRALQPKGDRGVAHRANG